ncbi:MAG: NAD-dependent malic enzyme [Methylococcaceae bacterium]
MENKRHLYIPFAGPILLETPLLNKGSAFSDQERQQFNLEGLLPHNIETIDEQAIRAYEQLNAYHSDIEKHIYLRNVQDTNETLYFRILKDHLEELMPLIYTPTVGEACQQFSRIYRRKRGLFISYPDKDRIDYMLQNATKHNVKVIVVTDGERILGLGDQGIGGMGIPVGKLALYTACGGISPAYTLPVVLDVGSNNEDLIKDPMYMGWRHERIKGDDYYAFVDAFIQAVKLRWPKALLQFEDFAQANAMPLLNRYRNQLCCFNDDIQGTAAVTVGTLLAACVAKGERLADQRVVFVGAGSAGCGIAEQIIAFSMVEGLSEPEARSRIFMVDQAGLVTQRQSGLLDFQRRLAQADNLVEEWRCDYPISLLDVVKNVQPTVLVGVSGQPGLFSEQIIKTMAATVEQPIIFPLSNPNSRAEANPQNLIEWTQGKAMVATGSPFDPVFYQGQKIPVVQCNNSYIFPGVGLGVIAVDANRVTENMLMAASKALADLSPRVLGTGQALLPSLAKAREASLAIAKAVALQAMADGVAVSVHEDAVDAALAKNFWEPCYREYRRTSF